MNFLSLSFAGFGLCVFAAFWGLSPRFRPYVLALANLGFAAVFGWQGLAVLLAVTLWGFAAGRWCHKHPKPLILSLSVGILVALLCSYKYLPLSGGMFSSLVAPVGLSFYTFKSISYLVQCYQGRQTPASPLHYWNYLSFFPQLSSGPIQPADQLLGQLTSLQQGFSSTLAYQGCIRLCWGMFLKKCLADPFAAHMGALTDPEHYYGISIVWATISYGLFLYFDFASYSQLSIGISNLLGFKVEENFLSPYFSKSIGEFWRRWHISLSRFLREYIYFPLGGSRHGTTRRILASLVTFLVSGIWHGATSGFVVWGLLHGVYILVQRIWNHCTAGWKLRTSWLYGLASWAVTMLAVFVGWFFFATGTVEQAGILAAYLFQPAPFSLQYLKESLALLGYTSQVMLQLGVFSLLAFGVDWCSRKEGFGAFAASLPTAGKVALCYVCLFACLFFGASGTLPNVYFAF